MRSHGRICTKFARNLHICKIIYTCVILVMRTGFRLFVSIYISHVCTNSLYGNIIEVQVSFNMYIAKW